PHVGAVARQRDAIHAAPKAVVYAVLDGFHRTAARPILRVSHEHTDPGAVLATAVIQMTAHTSELVADVCWNTVSRGGQQGATAAEGSAQRPSGDERVGRPAERDVAPRGWARIRTATRQGERESPRVTDQDVRRY